MLSAQCPTRRMEQRPRLLDHQRALACLARVSHFDKRRSNRRDRACEPLGILAMVLKLSSRTCQHSRCLTQQWRTAVGAVP